MPRVAAAPAISISGLRVIRGGRTVLPGITLDIAPGSVTGLLGPSGCGKSTLLRSIVGVQKVAGGEVTVLGHPAGSPRLRSRVAYTTQAPSVYLDLTVAENLRYFARVLGAPDEAVARAVATVGLEGTERQQAGRLSGGQLARVSLAAALLASPEVLILDEPTVGLDPVLRVSLWETFHALAREGATLLVSTHVMDEADRCDDVLLMRDGEVLARGTPAELLAATGAPDIESAFLRLVARKGTTA